MLKEKVQVLNELKELVGEKGFIYALCIILVVDFNFNLEKAHQVNYKERLSNNEASFLLSLILQTGLNLSLPDSFPSLLAQKEKLYRLLEELHRTYSLSFIDSLKKRFETHEKEEIHLDKKELFCSGEMLQEPIFYSGTGVYDFQFLEFLNLKYKYDKDWLLQRKSFDIELVPELAQRIKMFLQKKLQKINLYNLKEEKDEIFKREFDRNLPKDQKELEEILPFIELHQFVNLFLEGSETCENESNIEEKQEFIKNIFFKNLLDLFTINHSDFADSPEIIDLLNKFSFSPEHQKSQGFGKLGDYSVLNSKPVIRISNDSFFVPNCFLLFEAIYESPFYWMWDEDVSYRSKLAHHRGVVGEEIAFHFLTKVFGTKRTYKTVKVKNSKGEDLTDIDVLCILGSKALCVQVKSKKLTFLARAGNVSKIKEDFRGAVQDAYEQGIVSRKEILRKDANYFDENDAPINLPEGIEDVFIMCVTTENFPGLVNIGNTLLERDPIEPYPVFLSVFDLELLTHYLNDPYEFLYYIRQRISTMDHFVANEEIVFLGYHLVHKLWKRPNCQGELIDSSFGQLVDRNYYPFKCGIEVTDEGDSIKAREKNPNFERLCDQLKELKQPKITNIIFHLLDFSEEGRKNLVKILMDTKCNTSLDKKLHSFCLPSDKRATTSVGIAYISLPSNNFDELEDKLLKYCQAKKYQLRYDVWIGFGSLSGSKKMVDLVIYSDEKWQFDKDMEEASNKLLTGKGRYVSIGEEIGRNERCPCGSGLKYKKCCMP